MLQTEVAYERLRASGLRLTPQRRAVVEQLAGDTSHPTADSVAASLAERVPGMSLSTVYKVLYELSELGLVRVLDVPGAKRFDPDVEDHAHIACDECGSVCDVPMPASVRRCVAAAVSETGASVDRLEVVVHGSCPACYSVRVPK